MTKTILAATILALSAAALPAFAAEEYQDGPAAVVTSSTPTRDVGSAQTPAFDGGYALATPTERLMLRNNSSAAVESKDSAPADALVGFLPATSPRG